jgi:hypothetical protein
MKSPRGSPRLMRRSSSSSSMLLEPHPSAALSVASERSPLLIPPRYLQQQQQRRSSSASASSDQSDGGGGFGSSASQQLMRRTNSDRSVKPTKATSQNNNCLTSSWIWQMVWSRTTLLVFVAGSLVLLGVGITNIRYQHVNSLRYQQQQQSLNPSAYQNLTKIGEESQPETLNQTLASDLSFSRINPWPPTATEIADAYSTIANGSSTNSITFGVLASAMLPIWYRYTLDAIELFQGNPLSSSSFNGSTTTKQELSATAVSRTRMDDEGDLEWIADWIRTLLWYTNELLDIFAPFYVAHDIIDHVTTINGTN